VKMHRPMISVDRFVSVAASFFQSRTAAFWGLLVLGLVVRGLLMPFAFHPDLPWFAYGSHLMVFHGEVPGDFWVDTLPRVVYAATIWVFRPFFASHEWIWPHEWMLLSSVGAETPADLWMRVASAPQIHLALVLLKVPHLLFDLISAALILFLLKEKKSAALWAFGFWMLNPISLYVSYIYGRYDVMAAPFVLLTLYFFRRQRPLIALLVAGLAMSARLVHIVWAPFILFGALSQLRAQKRLWVGVSLLCAFGIFLLGSGILLQVLKFAEALHGQYLLMARIHILLNDALVLFVIAYLLIFFGAFERGLRTTEVFWKYSTITMLTMFALTFFHPQFFFALLPFLAIEIGENPRLLLYHSLQVVGYIVYLFNWGAQTTWWLFLPVDAAFFSRIPPPEKLLEPLISPIALIAIFRSVLTAASLWMAYVICRTIPLSGAICGRLNDSENQPNQSQS